jgi:anti-anti-sigma regulatory factor
MSLTTRPPSTPAENRSAVPGTFHVLSDGETLAWSEPVFRAHGFQPGDVVPSTALMLAHCHRDDRAALEAVLRETPGGSRPGEGRSVRYRLLDAAGQERVVLVVLAPADARGTRSTPPDAPTDGSRAPQHVGLLVDLGAEIGATAARRADEMLSAAIASREVIDQAKGAVMLAYGLDGPAAFEFLRWHSEHLNVKVRTVAERILASLPGRRADVDARELIDTALASLADVPGATGAALDGSLHTNPHLPAELVVRHAQDGRAVLVRLEGEVDASTAPTLVAGLAEALRAVPPRGTLVLDASGLHRLGPVAGLHISRLRRRCEHAGVALRMVPPSAAAREAGQPAEMRTTAPRSSM